MVEEARAPVGPSATDPGRLACLTWLQRRLDLDVPRSPDLLWHYTDAGGLMGIVTRERLWATRTSFLNDSTEMAYGVELVSRALATYDLGQLHDETARFVTALFERHQAALSGALDRDLEVYVTCFCADGDLLSQWRAYAGRDDAGGYALGLGTTPPLHTWPERAPGGHDLHLRRVLYDPVEQQAACHELVDTLIAVLDPDPHDPELQDSFARNLVSGVVEFASWCKDPAFEEEQEWRIVYVRSNDPDPLPVHHRLSRGLLVPYVELALPCLEGPLADHLPLHRVDAGPGPEAGLKLSGVRSLLSGLDHFAQVELRGSTAPLRL